MLVDSVRFLHGFVMPQKTTCRQGQPWVIRNHVFSLLTFPMQTQRPKRSRALRALGACGWSRWGSGSCVSVSAWGLLSQGCRLLTATPRAHCSEDKVLFLGGPETPSWLAGLQGPVFTRQRHSPPCKGQLLKCLRKEILLSRVNTPPLPSLIYTIYLLSRLCFLG